MSVNKKTRNTQIPLEAIAGAAGYDAKYRIVGLSNEQILALNELKEEYKTIVTNESVREISSIDLRAGSTIKAYSNIKNQAKKADKDEGHETRD